MKFELIALSSNAGRRSRSAHRAGRLFAAVACAVLFVGAVLSDGSARAQVYVAGVDQTPPPLYPYRLPAPPRYLDMRPYAGEAAARRYHAERHRPRTRVKIVHEPPIVIETRRYVDDKPRVIERYRIADDKATQTPDRRGAVKAAKADAGRSALAKTPETATDRMVGALKGKPAGADSRVIHADAEITIIGPDRMSIRLLRKDDGRKANARAP